MKKITKRLTLQTQTIRVLQGDDLSQVQGGTSTIPTSVIRPTGTSVIAPGTTGQSFGTSVIVPGGGH